ncbi:hypothetical protein HMPREF1531_01468 [Propionibacterium sp. oral taxon 192 str. F0372]|uniref:alpha/beta hydrolase n=1 Tax=Propionibacterium sp. oral taxon 192 TaxID=671222 RepID=UPI000352D833|nr:alpha/beta fold hydrolase [Propionibacterium sp. oral taxon 192]EPH03408.1 hypothetical protein HMPREF1531_01468 [Propionibacterium sp. oral taxon 192 str. F0372]
MGLDTIRHIAGSTARSLVGTASRWLVDVSSIRRPATNDSPAFDLSYIRTGPRGRIPVLVVPGGPGLGSILPYFSFRHRAAARGLDVIMVEHRGVGSSRTDLNGADLPFSAMRIIPTVDDLAAVLEAEQIDRAVILGSSYGSYLAAGLGVRHPHLVTSMLLDSPLLSSKDDLILRQLIRDTLWHGKVPGMTQIATEIRHLHTEGMPETALLIIARTVYELGGPGLLRRLIDARHTLRGSAVWKAATAIAGSITQLPSVHGFHEFDLAGVIAIRELGFAPPPDDEPFDVALLLAETARQFPPFEAEPFNLVEEFPLFTWPTVVLTGTRDLSTPPSVAHKIAGLIPGATLVELDNGHGALDSHELATLEVIEQLADAKALDAATTARLSTMRPRGASVSLTGILEHLLPAQPTGQ